MLEQSSSLIIYEGLCNLTSNIFVTTYVHLKPNRWSILLSLCRPHPSVVYGAFYDREAKSKSLHLWQRQRSLSRKPKGDLLSAALAHSKVPTRAVGTIGPGGHSAATWSLRWRFWMQSVNVATKNVTFKS